MGRIVRILLALGVMGCVEAAAPRPLVAQPVVRDPQAEASYTVRSGDTLWSLARRFGVSRRALAERNGIGDPRLLQIGSVLVIPRAATPDVSAGGVGPRIHVVRTGATPYSLARRYGLRLEDLMAENGIEDPRRLAIGRRLRLPAEAGHESVPAGSPNMPRQATAAAASAPSPERTHDARPRQAPVEDPSSADIEQADAILAELEDDYRRASFEGVLERAPEIDRLLDSYSAHPEVRRRQARAAFITGASLAALGRSEEALASFERAYRADPELELDPAFTSPRLAELLDAARRR